MLLNLTFVSSEEERIPFSFTVNKFFEGKDGFFTYKNMPQDTLKSFKESMENFKKQIKDGKIDRLEILKKESIFRKFLKNSENKKEEFFIQCKNNFPQNLKTTCLKYKKKPSDLNNLSEHLKKEKNNFISLSIKSQESDLKMESKEMKSMNRVCFRNSRWQWYSKEFNLYGPTTYLEETCFYSKENLPEKKSFMKDPTKKDLNKNEKEEYMKTLEKIAIKKTNRKLTREEERDVRYKDLGWKVFMNASFFADHRCLILGISTFLQITSEFFIYAYIQENKKKYLQNQVNFLQVYNGNLRHQNIDLQSQNIHLQNNNVQFQNHNFQLQNDNAILLNTVQALQMGRQNLINNNQNLNNRVNGITSFFVAYYNNLSPQDKRNFFRQANIFFNGGNINAEPIGQ